MILPDDIELVIFDKDGTLIDFDAMWSGWAAGLAARLEAATRLPLRDPLAAALGFDPATGRAIPRGRLAARPMAELRALAAGALVEAGLSAADAEAALTEGWQPPDPVALAQPLADLPALFGRLRKRGLRVAVLTADDRAPTEASLASLGLLAHVDALACADDGGPIKPDPRVIGRLCRMLGVHPSHAAVVSDLAADLRMARAAGVGLCVGVLSGVDGDLELAPYADRILASVADLA